MKDSKIDYLVGRIKSIEITIEEVILEGDSSNMLDYLNDMKSLLTGELETLT